MKKHVRIGIDCRLAGIDHTGIGRYIEELTKRVTMDANFEWILTVSSDSQLRMLDGYSHIHKVVAPVRHYTIQEQLLMPGIFNKQKLDLLHVPHFNIPVFYSGKMIVTIHDLLWHEQKGSKVTTLSPFMYTVKYQAYTYVAFQAIVRAQKIIVPTHAVKNTILRLVHAAHETKLEVTYEGVDASWFVSVPKKFSNHNTSLFYTGSLYPHKNLDFILDTLRTLPTVHLYVSSARSVFTQAFLSRVKSMGIEPQVTFLGRLEDDELRTWYTRVDALLQPSKSEGFGLTGLEALASGLPVIASDIAVFKEVYKDQAIYFDPTSKESFIHAVSMLGQFKKLTTPQQLQDFAKQYTWEKTAKETLALYQSVL